MAILMDDTYVRCNKCNSVYLIPETLVTVEKKTVKGIQKYIETPYKKIHKCAHCGKVVLEEKL